MSTIKLFRLRFFGSPLGILLSVLLLSGPAFAQTVTGTISGIVLTMTPTIYNFSTGILQDIGFGTMTLIPT